MRSMRPPAPTQPKMVGTILPQDSMRGLNGRERQLKLIATAGLDLFRQGLAFDGVLPTRQEPRHPAVEPNMLSIPENDALQDENIAGDSQLIVVMGGPLNIRGEPGIWVSSRIALTIQLYWQIMRGFAEQQQTTPHATPSLCYVVPTGGETIDQGVLEAEAIRNALMSTGISGHHMIMDCTATSIVENAVQLVHIVRHHHVQTVHIVTSEFHVPRTRFCFESIFQRLASDLNVQIVYHSAPDSLTSTERAEQAVTEQTLMRQARLEIDKVLRTQPKKRHSSLNMTRRCSNKPDTTSSD